MDTEERRALGAFLRAQRARLSPAAVGLPAGHRRKTPGLRREEVAFLAGISVTWYTWIEQGREVRISDSVLDSLARVLDLSTHERAYVRRLATGETIPPTPQIIAPHLQQILDHQGAYPAYIMGPFWDMLAWNRAAVRFFGDWSAMQSAERNMIWYTFARPQTRTLVVDWQNRARRLLAEFRGDCGQHVGDPALAALLERLRSVSPEFAAWWEDYEVLPRDGGRREFDHPLVGRLALQQTTLLVSNHPEIKLVLHMPAEGESHTQKLAMLHAMETYSI